MCFVGELFNTNETTQWALTENTTWNSGGNLENWWKIGSVNFQPIIHQIFTLFLPREYLVNISGENLVKFSWILFWLKILVKNMYYFSRVKFVFHSHGFLVKYWWKFHYQSCNHLSTRFSCNLNVDIWSIIWYF